MSDWLTQYKTKQPQHYLYYVHALIFLEAKEIESIVYSQQVHFRLRHPDGEAIKRGLNSWCPTFQFHFFFSICTIEWSMKQFSSLLLIKNSVWVNEWHTSWNWSLCSFHWLHFLQKLKKKKKKVKKVHISPSSEKITWLSEKKLR